MKRNSTITDSICRCRRVVLSALFLIAALAATAKTYVVAVGLTDYEKEKNSLPCSRNDMQQTAKFFKEYAGAEVFVLIDQNATRDHILRVVKKLFGKATQNDMIVFAYSGHGFDGGITCYAEDEVIHCQEIQALMRSAKAKQKIMLVMSCHSGSFTKRYAPLAAHSNTGDLKKSDVMLFLSSRANESSYEHRDMKMSFFFDSLLSGLKGKADANKDRRVTARELYKYVRTNVLRATANQQHPQMWGQFDDNMVLMRY